MNCKFHLQSGVYLVAAWIGKCRCNKPVKFRVKWCICIFSVNMCFLSRKEYHWNCISSCLGPSSVMHVVKSKTIFLFVILDLVHLYTHTHTYHQTYNISRILVGNMIANHTDVVGALPVGAAQLHRYCRETYVSLTTLTLVRFSGNWFRIHRRTQP